MFVKIKLLRKIFKIENEKILESHVRIEEVKIHTFYAHLRINCCGKTCNYENEK